MGSHFSLILLINLSILLVFSSIKIDAQQTEAARLLDRVLGDYAFRYYTKRYNTKTGFLYRVRLPNNFSDVQADVVRFRCGSLRRYGASIKEFRLATGITVQPCVERVVFIRQNLGKNWSSVYYGNYNLSGYQLVSPVLGLLAYDATDLSSTRNLSQLEIFAERNPVKIYFSNVTKIKSIPGVKSLCARFGSDGKVSIYDPVSSNVCVTARHGHFGLVIEAPVVTVDQPVGKLSEWKIIIGSSIGGAVGVFLLGLLLIAMVVKVKKRSKMAVMERIAYEEEALQISMVGHVRMPTAPVTRTRPSIEHEYSPP